MATSPSFNDESNALGQTEPKVVVVHDYCTQRGGAERVTLDLLRAFPGARLVTSFWEPKTTYPDFADFDVETLWVDKLGPLRNDPRRAFPLLASVFAHHAITDADVVICSSSGWSHRIATDKPKIVYCHNPARWLYQPHDYLRAVPQWARDQFVAKTRRLRQSDLVAARGAARYLVNSEAVAARVRDAYGLLPTVVPPARGLGPDGPLDPVPGIEPGYLLTVGRPRGYKHTESICKAVTTMPGERLVVVGGTKTEDWPHGVTGVRNLSDAQMRWLYSNAKALIAVAHEDFGLTPVEAQAFGIPSVLLRAGGYLDSTVEGLTGVFIEDASTDAIASGIHELSTRAWNPDAIRRAGERFSQDTFARRMRREVMDLLRPASGRGSDLNPVRPSTSQVDDAADHITGRVSAEVTGA